MYSFEEIYELIKQSDSMENFCKKCGGFSVYIPQTRPDYKERVLEEYNGYNEHLLATKYNVTLRTVQEIVKSHPKNPKKNRLSQPSLF